VADAGTDERHLFAFDELLQLLLFLLHKNSSSSIYRIQNAPFWRAQDGFAVPL